MIWLKAMLVAMERSGSCGDEEKLEELCEGKECFVGVWTGVGNEFD
jgi:hypothetical protein